MIVKSFSTAKADARGFYTLTTSGQALARLWFLKDRVLRFKLSFDGVFTEHSYALVTTAWEDGLDTLLRDERVRIAPLVPHFEDRENAFIFTTAALKVTVQKNPAQLIVEDLESGEELYRSLKGRSFEKDHLGRVFNYLTIDYERDHFYGFGETSGYLDKKGRHLRFCPRDSIGADPETGMPLYKLIPLCIRTREPSLTSTGFFYNNSHDTVFDLGNERSGYFDSYAYYQTDGGPLDLFIMAGPTVKDVVREYTALTGTTALPPKHALGFTLSTMYYAELEEHCDEEIYRVLEKHRREGIPVDNFWLASGYSSGETDNKRYTFNWNRKRFPSPESFFKRMQELCINVIPNLKPGVLTTHPYLEYYKERDALIKDPEGKEPYLGSWWGGPGYFVDFTGEKGRSAWKELLKRNILNLGCTTVWNDNNEMDGVEDRDARVNAEGAGGTMAEYKVLHANLMAYLGKEALAETYPQLRPYIINRSGFAGIQRYAQVWGGDNLTSWKTLKFNVALILGMGLSGCANMGCDIGGFTGPAPDAELLTRWIQQGIFQPRFVLNSANTDNSVTQPFMYPETLPYIRKAFRLRYRLLPYWYALFYEAYVSGAPIVRPLFYEFPDDPKTYTDTSLTFMLGSSLLVANVLEKGAGTRTLYLPAGATWYDLNDNLKAYAGGTTVTVPVSLDTIPLFIRSEAIIPSTEDIEVIDRDTVTHLKWLIATEGRDMQFTRFDDDGLGNGYKGDNCLKTRLKVTGREVITLSFEDDGNFENSVRNEELKVILKTRGAREVRINNSALPRFLTDDDYRASPEGWYYNLADRTVWVKYARPDARAYTVVVNASRFDLIGMENDGDRAP